MLSTDVLVWSDHGDVKVYSANTVNNLHKIKDRVVKEIEPQGMEEWGEEKEAFLAIFANRASDVQTLKKALMDLKESLNLYDWEVFDIFEFVTAKNP